MAKYYSVRLYDVRYKDGYKGQAIYIDDIIVAKNWGKAQELLTEYPIEILPDSAKINRYKVISTDYYKQQLAEETGYHLVTFSSEFHKRHLVTPQMIEDYVDQYECDDIRFKEIYEDIKSRVGTKEQKAPTVKQLVRTYQGTKK